MSYKDLHATKYYEESIQTILLSIQIVKYEKGLKILPLFVKSAPTQNYLHTTPGLSHHSNESTYFLICFGPFPDKKIICSNCPNLGCSNFVPQLLYFSYSQSNQCFEVYVRISMLQNSTFRTLIFRNSTFRTLTLRKFDRHRLCSCHHRRLSMPSNRQLKIYF